MKISTTTGTLFAYKKRPEKAIVPKVNPATLTAGEAGTIDESNTTNKVTLLDGTKSKDTVLIFLSQLAQPLLVEGSAGPLVTLTNPGFYYFVWDTSGWRMME